MIGDDWNHPCIDKGLDLFLYTRRVWYFPAYTWDVSLYTGGIVLSVYGRGLISPLYGWDRSFCIWKGYEIYIIRVGSIFLYTCGISLCIRVGSLIMYTWGFDQSEYKWDRSSCIDEGLDVYLYKGKISSHGKRPLNSLYGLPHGLWMWLCWNTSFSSLSGVVIVSGAFQLGDVSFWSN